MCLDFLLVEKATTHFSGVLNFESFPRKMQNAKVSEFESLCRQFVVPPDKKVNFPCCQELNVPLWHLTGYIGRRHNQEGNAEKEKTGYVVFKCYLVRPHHFP